MGDTKIEWTDATWNPIRGCSVVSEGCRNCYAMTVAARFSGKGPDGKDLPYAGLAYRNESGAHWTGKVRLIEEHLNDPLKWRKPKRVFVNSMSDLFHESIPDEWIVAIFRVMEASTARRHSFQILTKRPQRMLDFISKRNRTNPHLCPAENIWLGVSVEDQKTADERIPLLLETPAAVRWVSAEPLLGPVDFTNLRGGTFNVLDGIDFENIGDIRDAGILSKSDIPSLDWAVVGGESGLGARVMRVDWARSIIQQCQAAGVPVFMKQVGRYPSGDPGEFLTTGDTWQSKDELEGGPVLQSRKGGNVEEWPKDLQVREFPKAVA
ncbi:MAG: phage Gp37/Gp68 family protein [Acidobacteriota bacterium]